MLATLTGVLSAWKLQEFGVLVALLAALTSVCAVYYIVIQLRSLWLRATDKTKEPRSEKQEALAHAGRPALLSKAERLGERRVASLMTPRQDIMWLEADMPLAQAWQECVHSGHQVFPIGRGSLDQFVGIVRLADLADAIVSNRAVDLSQLATEPLTVPATLEATRLLVRLREEGRQLAVVIDEYGGVDGIISTQDLIEALVGEFAEGSDEPNIIKRADGSWLVDAAQDIDEVFEALSIPAVPHDDRRIFYSLGGFIMGQLGALPREGERFDYEGFRFEVVDMDKKRIDKVLIARLP